MPIDPLQERGRSASVTMGSSFGWMMLYIENLI